MLREDIVDDLRAEIDTLRERVRQLEQALMPNAPLPVEWGLTAAEARLFSALTARDMATKEQLMTALYSGRPDEEPEIKIIDVFVCKIRKKLKPFGVKINTVWGQGYSLVERGQWKAAA
jgi:two-component system cell cycle response regulator CtrA